MRTFLQITSFIVFFLGVIVAGFYLLNNLVLQENSLEAWLPVLVALPSMMFSAAFLILVEIADHLVPLKSSAPKATSTLDTLFPERKRKSLN